MQNVCVKNISDYSKFRFTHLDPDNVLVCI